MNQPVLVKNKLSEFVKLSNLKDTDPPVFCPVCGVQKKEYQLPAGFIHYVGSQRMVAPEAARLLPIACECEKHLQMLKDWFKLNLEICGGAYEAWKAGGKADENRIGHYKTMLRCKSEIDRINALVARK